MIERTDVVAVDELAGFVRTASAADSDKGDLVTEFALYLCDRRGFPLARRSPGSPEPQHGFLPLE